MTRKDILQEAERCVCTSRQEEYGPVEDNFRVIADLWTVYLRSRYVGFVADVCILPEDVGVLMSLLKIARIATGTFKTDSYVDACGYLACAGELAGHWGDGGGDADCGRTACDDESTELWEGGNDDY